MVDPRLNKVEVVVVDEMIFVIMIMKMKMKMKMKDNDDEWGPNSRPRYEEDSPWNEYHYTSIPSLLIFDAC